MVNDRSVDVVDWEKGEVVGRLRDMSATGIVSVSERRCWGVWHEVMCYLAVYLEM